MKVLVAGASGILGRQLVPQLEAAGHEVIGLARTVQPGMGAIALPVDVLNRGEVVEVVKKAQPHAIVNLVTGVPDRFDPKSTAPDFQLTNQLRVQGTENLRFASQRAGVQQFISQSIAFGYEPRGVGPANEKAAFWRDPPTPFGTVLDSIRRLESSTLAMRGTVLRFGHLYGPGTSFTANGWFFRDVLAGKMPMVGRGSAMFSFIHVRDAAAAIVAAVESPERGVFNIVDDDPSRVNEWLPGLARMMRAPQPRRLPMFLAGFAMGPWGLAYMTRLRGAENALAKTTFDWQPKFRSWRDGFAAELAY